MSDVCAVLEIDNPRNIAARLDDDEPEAGSGVAKMASADVLVSRNVHSPNAGQKIFAGPYTPNTKATTANPQPSRYKGCPILASIARSPPPTLRERRHRRLARGLISMRRRAPYVAVVAARPHLSSSLSVM
jgi:hypothetical protein